MESKIDFQQNKNLPIKVIQFGEGNFLRAFADYMLQELTRREMFSGGICVFNLRRTGSVEKIKKANFKYHLISRGIENSKPTSKITKIESITDALNPYQEFERFIELAKIPELRFVISNSTEAGIALNEIDALEARPPESFPAKLTLLLFERFKFFEADTSKGLVILPCELIENNATTLKNCVVTCAQKWALPQKFLNWLEKSCVFCNTLVDRIVSGHPSPTEQDPAVRNLDDPISVVAEPYLLWAIEAPESVARELPFDKCGLNVVYTNDIAPYRQRKVFLLNAPHTLMSAVGLQMGLNTVLDAVSNPTLRMYLENVIFNELAQTLPMPIDELTKYASDVLDRFANPYLEHFLKSIAENSIAKTIVRVVVPIENYFAKFGKLPNSLLFGLAANIVMAFNDKQKLPSIPEAKPLLETCNLREFVNLFATSNYFSGSVLCSNKKYAQTLSDFAEKINTQTMTNALKNYIDENIA